METHRFFILLLFILFLSQTNYGQIGLTAGASSNWFQYEALDEEVEEITWLAGYHAGFFYNIPLSSSISLRPELKYAKRGASLDLEESKDNISTASFDGYDRTIFHYIEFPVFLSYKKNRLRGYAGPYLGTCFRAINIYDYEVTWPDLDGASTVGAGRFNDEETFKPVFGEPDQEDYEDGVLDALDLGFELGVGYNFGLFELGLSYNHGLNNLIKDDPSSDMDERDEDKVRNRSIRLSFYYTLSSGKSDKFEKSDFVE